MPKYNVLYNGIFLLSLPIYNAINISHKNIFFWEHLTKLNNIGILCVRNKIYLRHYFITGYYKLKPVKYDNNYV